MSSEPVTFTTLDTCTFEQAAQLWNEGFSGYGTVRNTTPSRFVDRMAKHHIRPELSVVAKAGERPIGFVLIAVCEERGQVVCWNGGTGLAPAYRGRGLGKLLMQKAVESARAGGGSRFVLEVVRTNTSALRAYESAGFKIIDELAGYERTGALEPAAFMEDTAESYCAWPVPLNSLPDRKLYRHMSSWDAKWHVVQQSNAQALLILDGSGEMIGYVVFSKPDRDKIVLHHCEADNARPDRERVINYGLKLAFNPWVSSPSLKRAAANIPDQGNGLPGILEQLGFQKSYEQYLMEMVL